jgi:ABC-type nitrate/sulfonate/bicarbonate transport system substrate-binding protein
MDQLKVTGFRRRPAYLVAERKGLFAEAGIEVDYHTITFAPDHNQGMAEGRWNISLSAPDTMIARATGDGHDFALVMQMEQGLVASLVGRANMDRPEDLKGRLLAGDPGDSNLDLIRRKILRSHGVMEDDYEVEIIGSSPKRLAAFVEGRVAGTMLAPPYSEKALAAGAVLLAEAADYVPDWPLTCAWSLRSWFTENRDLTVRFIRACADATDWLLAPENRDEALRIIMEETNVDRDRADAGLKGVVPKVAINPAALTKLLELRIEMNVYAPPHSPAEAFYDARYWSEATGLPAPEPGGLPSNAVT